MRVRFETRSSPNPVDIDLEEGFHEGCVHREVIKVPMGTAECRFQVEEGGKVGDPGLEPGTSSLSEKRSDRLS
jgi:hypothetical protein